jgi:Tfp pilus assembly protein PilN
VRAVNLIPAEQRRGAGGLAGRSGGIVYVLSGGLVLLVVFGVVYALAVHKVSDNKRELASLTQQVASVNTQAQALQPYVQVAQMAAEKVGEVTTLANQRFNWPGAMQQLALALPSDVTLTSFGATTAAPGATVPTSAGASNATFTLTGCARSQAEISQVLIDLTSIPGVTNVALDNTAENASYAKISGTTSPEAAAGGCPLVTFNVTLSYSGTYTVPTSNAPSGSTGAQTVSAPTGSTSIKTAASGQSTGVTR